MRKMWKQVRKFISKPKYHRRYQRHRQTRHDDVRADIQSETAGQSSEIEMQ